MAAIVRGIGTSPPPRLSLPPEMWAAYAPNDRAHPDLLAPPDATPLSSADLVAHVGARYAAVATPPHVHAQDARAQRAITTRDDTLCAAAPDTVVIISDD